MSKGNREKKKPKQDKPKNVAPAKPFGAASNAGKPSDKRK
jgi:hypothetical protein